MSRRSGHRARQRSSIVKILVRITTNRPSTNLSKISPVSLTQSHTKLYTDTIFRNTKLYKALQDTI